MKKIDYNLISSSLGMRFKSGMLNWLQQAPNEVSNHILKSILNIPYYQSSGNLIVDKYYTIKDYKSGDDFTIVGASSNANGISFKATSITPTWTNGSVLTIDEVYIIYGIRNTGSGSNYIISEGAVFFQNEIFYVPSTSFNASGTAILNIVSTNLLDSRHDPVSFSDGSLLNVHLDRTIEITDGLSGSGLVDFSDCVRATVSDVTDPQGTIKMFAGPLAGNFYSGLGINKWIGWALCDGNNGTPNLKGRFIVGWDPGDVDYNVLGKIGGSKHMPAHSHTLGPIYGTGSGSGDHQQLDYDGDSGPAYLTSTDSAGTGPSDENRPPYYTLAYVIKL